MSPPTGIVLPLAGTDMSKALPYILAAVIAGCGSSGSNRGRTAAASVTALVDRNDSGCLLMILKGDATVYRQVLSDAPVSEARIEGQSLDFDGDGQQEIVLFLWEGQNSGDRVLVFGEKAGVWSQWMDVYRPHFESEFVKIGSRNGLRVIDADAGIVKTVIYTPQSPGSDK
jgi:hypothetical protein